ncbi:MAG TPA: SDR family oxidoreductase [Terriglobia bacterium]
MRLLVVGSTGGTGLELVEQALEDGHEVTALARRPEALRIRHANLKVHQGDILDYDLMQAAVEGQHAVLSALGVRKLRKNTILSQGTRNLIRAMEKLGVKRFIVESSLGVGDSRGQLGTLFNGLWYPLLLRNVFADKETQESLVRSSRLEWVIVRPAILTNGPRTGRYKAGFPPTETSIRRRISRADTAEFMLKQLTDDKYLRTTPGLSY